MSNQFKSINVYGKPMKLCCKNPVTGYFRDGCCNTSLDDVGVHTVCILITEEFLKFTSTVGNDLSTPNLPFDFPGLKPGDRWCLCALRWKEAFHHNMAPPVFLESTHIETLKIIDINDLEKYAFN